MKRLLNTLYVTSDNAYLHKDGETVSIKIEGEVKMRMPIHTLESIVCLGHITVSPGLMSLCSEKNVSISFLSNQGRFLGEVRGPVSGNVHLRRTQYRYADSIEMTLEIARNIVLGKLLNCRTILLRANRERNEPLDEIINSIALITRHIKELSQSSTLDIIRGIEGDAARIYFSVFDHLIVRQKQDFTFNGRTRRPPMDNVNAILSFLYTLLAHDVRSALEGVGLDPQVGYLHKDRSGRPGLALDLMEEFRSPVVDRLVLKLINLQQIQTGGFTKTESGGVVMNDETRKVIISAYQSKKQDEMTHPFLNEKISFGLIPHVQALLFARYLRGDLESYPPFILK